MKLKWRSKARRKNDWEESIKSWHRKFTFWPLRIDDETVVLFGSYYRRFNHYGYGNTHVFEFITVDQHKQMVINELKGK